MRIVVSCFVLFFLITLAGDCYAFRFDVWTSGMTVDEALSVAQQNNLPIQKSGIISGDTKFNPSVRRHAASATKFYYRGELLGKQASVNLSFTPQSKKLCSVSIRWSGINRFPDFKAELDSILMKKYGKPAGFQKELFGDTRFWKADNTLISLQVMFSSTAELKYADRQLIEVEGRERSSIEKRTQESHRSKDESKF